MQMKDNNNIENLFKDKLADYKQTPNSNVWLAVDAKINKTNFFKFNATKFNIYYSVVIVIAIITSLYFIQTPQKNTAVIENATLLIEKNGVNKQTNKQTNQIKVIEIKSISEGFKYIKAKNNNVIVAENISNNENTAENYNNKIDITVENKVNTNNFNTNVENSEINNIKVEFVADYYSGCTPLEINFSNISVNCDSYEWDFGNGETSNLENPNFTFTNEGEYIVKLIAKSGNETFTYSKEIKVYETPSAGLIVSNKNNIFINDNVKFANISSNGQTYLWSFGDGTSSTKMHPEHTYSKKGIYSINLNVLSENNCSDECSDYKIVVKNSRYKVIAPNAFTPSMSGAISSNVVQNSINNDIFHLVFQYQVAEFKMKIYNRRGILVFETNRTEIGWNGYYRNTLQPMDVYIWQCSGKFIDGEVFYNSGDISLIHSTR